MFAGDEIIKRGSWLYDGSVPSAVVVTRGDFFLGSGDHEDPPEERDDREVETYRLWFESPPGSGKFSACGGQFFSVEEAVQHAATLLSSVRWE